jgi:uncharacterized protein
LPCDALAAKGGRVVLLLILSLAALAIGPALSAALEHAPRAKTAIEGVVALGLIALILGHVLPEAFELAHYWVLPVAAVSVLATLGLERWASATRGTSGIVLVLGMLALGFHSSLDGAALAGAEGPGGAKLLAVAVVLHRLPTSMAIWWVVTRALGRRWAVAVIAWDAVTTFGGYLGGENYFGAASSFAVGIAQAVIAGSLLHVAFHVRSHGHGHAVPFPTPSRPH